MKLKMFLAAKMVHDSVSNITATVLISGGDLYLKVQISMLSGTIDLVLMILDFEHRIAG